MLLGSAHGDIYIHKNNKIYIPDYVLGETFTVVEAELKVELINALIKCYRYGSLVNVRRHIAVSKVSGTSEKCVFDWRDEQVLLADAEVVLRTDMAVFYFKSSLIYNVFKYDYKPASSFTGCLLSQIL
ncbi:hypothetical protein VT06_01255 [Arsukibacterium sp. MJ3]|uniref:hypothetical protein n=1 Tax=Arsukibacterium sp. MJ3 TaxID=1632859 RepID=UPI00062737B5|nr:hypothetical protein [Arsukibacterium sp. MJ3]KKO50629.1 hypothetical protein VT06_01255 [Arsukibacterium sp. MJ3]